METKNDDIALWQSILSDDETLLWHGRPSTNIYMRRHEWPVLLVAAGCILVGGLVFLSDARSEAPMWFLFLAGLVALLGLCLIPHVLYRQKRERACQRYALTDKRALILYLAKVREMKVFPIAETNRLDLVKAPDGKTSVFFKDEFMTVKNKAVFKGTPLEFGFEFIDEGDDVLSMMEARGFGKGDYKVGITPKVSF